MYDSRFYTLALHRLPDVGAATFLKLTDLLGEPEHLLELPLSQLEKLLQPEALALVAEFQTHPPQSRLGKHVLADIAWLDAAPGRSLISIADDRYPPLLREIPKPPPLIFVRGNPECLSLPQLAIVGSRNPTAGGRENAQRFAQYLGRHGFAITSGLALGVDGAAHEGALEAGAKTIAVMGTGIDKIYPARHRDLAERIVAEGGALVSEFPLGTSSQAAHFPMRNRIISGLSAGVLVVEAAVQSGSLITASIALQQNREVFAIPGSIHNPLARGCHQLIRQGATLVETAQDIVDQLQGALEYQRELAFESPVPKAETKASKPELMPELSPAEQQLMDAIGFDLVSLDDLVERTGLPVGNLAGQLIGLEIKGLVQQMGAGYQKSC